MLRDARRSALDRLWLTNVYPLYLHDLSAYDDGYFTLDERGVWRPDHLPSWLGHDRDLPLLLVVDGQRVGFALVNRAPSALVTPGCDYWMSEFFVHARGARRVRAPPGKVGGESQLPRSERAIRFWRRVVAEASDGAWEEQVTADEVPQVFRTRLARAPRRAR